MVPRVQERHGQGSSVVSRILMDLEKKLAQIITAEYSLLLLNTSSNNRVIGIRVSFCQPDRCPSGSRKMISPG